MRRLPIYLLLDTSLSMEGAPIDSVKSGVQTLVSALLRDPYALETAYISIITFNTNAEQLTPLQELSAFHMPSIEATGATCLGNGLSMVSQCIKAEVTQNTFDAKGDWKPMVFIMTDGVPTDDWRKGLKEFKSTPIGLTVACAAGPYAKTEILKEVTEIVVQLKDTDAQSIGAFFKWVSASITVGSKKVNNGEEESLSKAQELLPPPPPEINLAF